MADIHTTYRSGTPRIVQLPLRTVALAVALPMLAFLGMAAMSSSNSAAGWEYKIVRPGEYNEVDGVEREVNGWGKDGWEVPGNVVIGRLRGGNNRANYRLQAGNGDFIVLKRQR